MTMKYLTFDCCETLIDWKGDILSPLKSILSEYIVNLRDEQILELYVEIESREETSHDSG